MEEEDRGRVWRLYGWFTALMACGSCVGAVAWAARMMGLMSFFRANASAGVAQQLALESLAHTWRSVFSVTYAVEFLCLSAAKLMVLDRMSVFAALQGTGVQQRWALAGQVVMAVVVLGNAVGLAANAAAAVYYHMAAEAVSKASVHYAANNTVDGLKLFSQSQEQLQRAGSIASVQLICEVAVLLLIVAVFVAVGALCARRVTAMLLVVEADSPAAVAGRALRLQMLATTGVVFIAFLLRSSFSIMYAVANQLREFDNNNCLEITNPCDASCYNIYSRIVRWMSFTPEFQSTIVLVSSPLALLVALWGMTTKTTLQLIQSSERDRAHSLSVMRQTASRS
jgi:hypothetical protein